MDCPICGGASAVIGTKNDGKGVYRERRCLDCERLFYTEEHISESPAKYKELLYVYYKNRKIHQKGFSKRYKKGK